MFPIRDLNPSRVTPYATLLLIAVNVLVFVFWQPHLDPGAEVEFLYRRAAVACEVIEGAPLTLAEIETGACGVRGPGQAAAFPEKQPIPSVFVSMFLHGGLAHLLGNMWFLWLFGNNVEEAFGHIRYLLGYIAAGIAATLGFVLLHPASTEPLVGASGAIAAVLGAYAVLYPVRLVLSYAFFAVLPVPAVIFLGLWFVGQFAVGDGGVAWEAHVTGFVVGSFVAIVFRRQLLGALRRRQAGW